MSWKGGVQQRVATLLRILDIQGGLLQTLHHEAGVFAELASEFDLQRFKQRIAETNLTKGYGNVWYSVDQHLEEGTFQRDRAVSAELPGWAQDVQRQLLAALNWPGAYGWAAEYFWSVDSNASIGVHIDNDDVYTVQLYGQKQWVVDPVNLDRLNQWSAGGRIFREGPWEAWVGTNGEVLGFDSPRTIVLKPGDFLALPAFALHHVVTVGEGESLSFNASICQEQAWHEFLASRARTPTVES